MEWYGARRSNPEKLRNAAGPVFIKDIGLTIIQPFCQDENRFKLQVENWRKYSDFVKDKVNLILVDDCSDIPLHTLVPDDLDMNLRIYRILDNLKWNTPGAWNLGFKHLNTEWALMFDSDCWFEPDAMEKILNLDPQPDYFYLFERKRIGGPRPYYTRYLPCCFLIKKEAIESVGGMDEDFTGEWSGGYGIFDNFFEWELRRKKNWKDGLVKDIICTEYHVDAMPDVKVRKVSPPEIHTNLNLRPGKESGETRNYNVCRFRWEQTYEHVRCAS